MKMPFKTIGILAGIIALSAALFCTYLALVVFDKPFDNKDFDQTLWLQFNGSSDPDNPRGEMYEDLIENHLSKGMNKGEVLSLLGDPDHHSEEHFISYNLGMWSGSRIDYDSLDLEFDENGELMEFRRVQH